jgi:hypothetical protein
MKKIKLFFVLVLLTIIFSPTFTKAQDEKPKKVTLDGNVDLVSRYIWRGMCLSKAPNIQPGVYMNTSFGLSVGAWGSYSIMGDYAEADFTASYTFKGVSLTFYDYFTMDESKDNNKYFDCKNATTAHQFDLILGYQGPDKFPIKFTAATMVYGADKRVSKMVIDTITSDTTRIYVNNYSTYLELGYTFFDMLDVFVGFTPFEGYYGTSLGVVNAGINAHKEFKITDKFQLPVFVSLITNPQKENIYFVAGVGFKF